MKPEFFRHHELFVAEQTSKLPLRIAFAGLWTVADRAGRFVWKPIEIKLDCLPYDDVDFSRVLDALESRGFILKYAEGKLGLIPGFPKHQVINNKERESVLPEPTQEEVDAWRTRVGRVEEVLFLESGEGKGREGKGTRKGREGASKDAMPAGFDAFWTAYPKKTAKEDALKAWQKLDASQDLQAEIMRSVASWSKSEAWQKDNGKFIPYPATWLNGKRWTDQIESGRRQDTKPVSLW